MQSIKSLSYLSSKPSFDGSKYLAGSESFLTLKPTDLLSPLDAATTLQVTVGTLAVWRCTGRYSLPFVKIGSKVFYRRSDISSFIESRIQTQTS